MNEFDLISQLTQTLPTNSSVIHSVGDDCAVLDLGIPGKFLLFKTDAVVEGIHFLDTTEPEKIGHKALARGLSDIAAMGGIANSALITIGLSKNFDAGFVKRIYAGINTLAERFQVAIVGGETTTNPDRILVSISLIGIVEKEKCVLRSGAQTGDAVFVTGELGGSLCGKHLDFEPRIQEARWLVNTFNISSMIDLSDGLAGDLRHILNKSNAGSQILGDSIPISRAAKLQARAEPSAKTPLLAALTDGEDFELLFTIRSRDAVSLLDKWKEQFPNLKLTCIGKILAQPGLTIRDKMGVRELGAKGFVHFGE